jgi:uncharacterized repeat protein (TIGR03803 family)
LSASAFGQTESVLYTFTDGPDGGGPFGELIFDSAGNLYGTTNAGGISNNGGYGVVFELSPATGGGWTESPLYAFQGGNDGRGPIAGVVFDTAGNIFGTTEFGGLHNMGTVYELSPAAGGGWTEQVLYSFAGSSDGGLPNSPLVFDAAGNLYGTAATGGSQGLGTVFQLSPVSGGGWTEKTILNGTAARGSSFRNVTFDNHGNLYTNAASGGSSNNGTIIRLTPTSFGWNAGVVYTFLGGADGSQPASGLTFQAPGRLFGATESGGAYGFGTVYELTPGGGGMWNKTTLFNFGKVGSDTLYPTNPLTIGPADQLYSTSGSGGSGGGGTAYELAKVGGVWKEKILYDFPNGGGIGSPNGGVVLDGAGNLYGTGHNGGASGAGGVYEIVP